MGGVPVPEKPYLSKVPNLDGGVKWKYRYRYDLAENGPNLDGGVPVR